MEKDDFCKHMSGEEVKKLCERCKKRTPGSGHCGLTVRINIDKVLNKEIWCNLFDPEYPEYIWEWKKKLEGEE